MAEVASVAGEENVCAAPQRGGQNGLVLGRKQAFERADANA